MEFQLTNAGITALLHAFATDSPITVSFFRVGDGKGYIPQPTDTALYGNELFTGGVAHAREMGNNTVRFTLIMDQHVGTFTFTEVGIYVSDATLLALAVLDQPQEKQHLHDSNPGNVVEIFADVIYQNIPQAVSLTVEDITYANMGRVSSVYALPQANLTANLNCYIADTPDVPGTFVLAILDDTRKLWQFQGHKKRFGPYTVAASPAPLRYRWGVTAPLEQSIEQSPPDNAYLVQVTSGNNIGFVGILGSYDRAANTIDLTDNLAGSLPPNPGDTFYVYVSDYYNTVRRSDPNIVYNGINYAQDTSPTANSIQLTMPLTLRQLADGNEITFKAANNNTGATILTILNSEGQINNFPIKVETTDDQAVALQGGEILQNGIYKCAFNSSFNALMIENPSIGPDIPGLTEGYYGAANVTVRKDGIIRAISSALNTSQSWNGANVFNANTTFNGLVDMWQRLTALGGIAAGFDSIGFNVRYLGGGYGAGWRNDGSNLYLLLTNSGDQYGSWNYLRPLMVNVATGGVSIDQSAIGTSFGGNLFMNNSYCLYGRDTSNTVRPMLDYDSGNNINVWCGLGYFRVLNSAGDRDLFHIDNAGNALFAGNVYFSGDYSFGLLGWPYTLQFAGNNYIQYNGNMQYGTTGTHVFYGNVRCMNDLLADGNVQASNVTAAGGYLRAAHGGRDNPGDYNVATIVNDFWLRPGGNGVMYFPATGGDFILQWGVVGVPPSQYPNPRAYTFNFNEAFPRGVFRCLVAIEGLYPDEYGTIGGQEINNSQFVVTNIVGRINPINLSATNGVNWWAIGH